MKQRRFNWEVWLDNTKKVDNSFNFYLKKELIKVEEETKYIPISHLKKAEYNFRFVNFLEDNKVFYDWIIIGCYYTIYHCALALITKKGFSSKNHLATLCTLIKCYYKKLTKEEFELVSVSSLKKEEVSYFVYAKEKREIASYGISEEFNKSTALDLRKKTVEFLNRTREIIEENVKSEINIPIQ